MKFRLIAMTLSVALLSASTAFAQLDGMNVGAGLINLGFQDTATGFGDATGGGQDSAGGSEIDGYWGGFSNGTLSLGFTGNLEANFNKFFLFIDAEAGGENTLDGTNVDGGFNEIQNMAGLTFDSGFTADHGIRFEVGSGFLGIRAFDLVDETAFDVYTSGGGPGDLSLTDVGSGGIQLGWDNSNVLGVNTTLATGANTATTGWEIDIDLQEFIGAGVQTDINVAGFITNGDGTFLSNQVIGGLSGAPNLGNPTVVNFGLFGGDQFITVSIPEPASATVLVGILGGVLLRRRK